MCCPAGDNEYGECHKHPVKRDVLSFVDEIDDGEWNGEIR
jgi:hypothetical protein